MSAPAILTLNAGSSSIKFALFDGTGEPGLRLRGQVESIGAAARLQIMRAGEASVLLELGPADHAQALAQTMTHLEPFIQGRAPAAVGHRIVHGGTAFAAPALLDDETLAQLDAFRRLAPLHQPHNLAAVVEARRLFPDAVQIGCFDTAFHHGHDRVSDMFALPRRFFDAGVRRYGFHGLSYEFIAGELGRIAPDIANGRVIIAHLGAGASMCALKAGRSIASTMGFSALDGLVMGTRSGAIDPGVLLYLMEHEGMDAPAISDLLYKQCGLKGVSGLSGDMRTLEQAGTPEADEAIACFTYRLRREIGSLAAALGGLDALVFTAGIGEHSARVRAAAVEGLGFLGLAVDDARNEAHAQRIGSGEIPIFIVPTDEERVIARAASRFLVQA